MLVDDDDLEVPVGEVGEFVARPNEPHVMFDGYLGRPGDTLALQRNLWHHTGDYGRKTEDGWFQFVDRKRDYMRRRGENVSAWEVEQVILSHPDVSEVACFGLPSEVSENDIMVVVRLEEGATVTHAELCDHCAANMPYFAVPRYFDFVAATLSNDLGKIPKFELQSRGVTSTTWDREAVGHQIGR
jgi:crotonobetaine/carnitine-CoA ligase